jgi:hypothetical protein
MKLELDTLQIQNLSIAEIYIAIMVDEGMLAGSQGKGLRSMARSRQVYRHESACGVRVREDDPKMPLAPGIWTPDECIPRPHRRGVSRPGKRFGQLAGNLSPAQLR